MIGCGLHIEKSSDLPGSEYWCLRARCSNSLFAIRRALDKEAAKADEYLSNETAKEESAMKRTENATNTLIIQAEKAKTKKRTPWRCTDKSCKVSFTCNLSGANFVECAGTG